MFQFFYLRQGVLVIKWHEKDEKVLKHSISVGNVLF